MPVTQRSQGRRARPSAIPWALLKNIPLQAQIQNMALRPARALKQKPRLVFPSPCSLSGRSGQAAGQWPRAVPLLPASRDGAAWERRKCHPAPTQRARWYLTAGAVKSCTRKNIFSCSWAVPRRLQSWFDTSLVHLPQSAVWDTHGCGTKRLRMTIGPCASDPQEHCRKGGRNSLHSWGCANIGDASLIKENNQDHTARPAVKSAETRPKWRARCEIFPPWNPDSTEGNRRAMTAFWTERATIQVFV